MPQYIKYDERTSWDQIQGFGEFEFKLFDNRLSLTPGRQGPELHPLDRHADRGAVVAAGHRRPPVVRPDAAVFHRQLPDQAEPVDLFPVRQGLPDPVARVEPRDDRRREPARCRSIRRRPRRPTIRRVRSMPANCLNIDGDVYYIKTSNSIVHRPVEPRRHRRQQRPGDVQGHRGAGQLPPAPRPDGDRQRLARQRQGRQQRPVAGPGPRLHRARRGGVQPWTDQAQLPPQVRRPPVLVCRREQGEPSVRASPYSLGIAVGQLPDRPGPGRRDGLQRVRRPLDDLDRRRGEPGRRTLYQFQSRRSVEGSVRFKF